MASKLAFISVLLALILVGVVAEKRGATSEVFKRRMRGYLERRQTERCIKECETNCKSNDHNCCFFGDTGRYGKCRQVSAYPEPEYMCIHPDYRYVSRTEVLHDDCGLKGK